MIVQQTEILKQAPKAYDINGQQFCIYIPIHVKKLPATHV